MSTFQHTVSYGFKELCMEDEAEAIVSLAKKHLEPQYEVLTKKMPEFISLGIRFRILTCVLIVFVLICLINASFIDISEVKSTVKGCQCSRQIKPIRNPLVVSNCDDFATFRGKGQKVVAYSYFGNSSRPRIVSHYLDQIAQRAKEVAKFYPDWVMRIYYRLDANDEMGKEKLCQFWCQNSHLDLCDVENLPIIGNLSRTQPIGNSNFFEQF